MPRVVLAVVWVWVCGACHLDAPYDGEFTESDCQDGIDNDGDGLIDCEERSCRVWSFCQDGGSRPPLATDMNPSMTEPGSEPSDTTPVGAEDAGTPHCGRLEACADDAGPQPAASYALFVTRAQVPERIDDNCLNPVPGDRCRNLVGYDCVCMAPTAYVEVWHKNSRKGRTRTVPASTDPTWEDDGPTVEALRLLPNEEILFRVMYESTAAGQATGRVAFVCSVAIGTAPTAPEMPLECAASSGNLLFTPHLGRVMAKLVPLL